MFAADRWAQAFMALLPGQEEAEEGLALLKTLAVPLSGIQGLFSGASAGARLDRLLHKVASRVPAFVRGPDRPGTAETVCRFLVLLVRRGRYRYIHGVIKAVEKRLDQRKGVVPVMLDTAFPLEQDYEERLKELLKKETGAREVRLEKRIDPGLLGGCRLQIGSEFLDTSLRARLRRMTEDLAVSGTAELGGL